MGSRRFKRLRKLGDLMDSGRRERWRKLRALMYSGDPNKFSGRRKRLRKLGDLKDSGRRERWRKLRALMYSGYPNTFSGRLESLPNLGEVMDSGRLERWRKLRALMYLENPRVDGGRRKRLRKLGDFSPSSSLSPPFPELCDDVMVEIISRLPGKCASRFKCVSKRWLGLIDSPDCFRLLQARARQSGGGEGEQLGVLAGLFYQRGAGDYDETKITAEEAMRVHFAPISCTREEEDEMKARGLGCLDETLSFLPHPVYIVGCRHGLLLCSRTKHNPTKYYVCNPITKQWIVLPKPNLRNYSFASVFFVSEEDGHYQVLRIPKTLPLVDPFDDRFLLVVEAFSSVTGQWKVSEFTLYSSPQQSPFACESAAVQVNGMLYWLCSNDRMVAYDVKKEQVKLVKLPDVADSNGCLGEWHGMLRYAFCAEGKIRLWELKKERLTLIRNSSIQVLLLQMFPYRLGVTGKPIGYRSDTQVLFLKPRGRILSFNLESKKVVTLASFDFKLPLTPQSVFPYFLPRLPIPVW